MKRAVCHLLMGFVLVAIATMAMGTKLYQGKFEVWFHNYAGGILYEVFWIVLVGVVFPAAREWLIAILVFVVTCGLEVLQLWHAPVLEAVRSNFVGKALIGDGFDPWDFIYYVVGSAIGWMVCRATRPWRRRLRRARFRP